MIVANAATPMPAKEVIPMQVSEGIPMLRVDRVVTLTSRVIPIQGNGPLPTPARQPTLMVPVDQQQVLHRMPHKVKHHLHLTLRKVTLPPRLLTLLLKGNRVLLHTLLIQLTPNLLRRMQLKVIQAPTQLKVNRPPLTQLKASRVPPSMPLKAKPVPPLTPLKARTVELVTLHRVMLNMLRSHRQKRVRLTNNRRVLLLLHTVLRLQVTVHSQRLPPAALQPLATVTVTARISG